MTYTMSLYRPVRSLDRHPHKAHRLPNGLRTLSTLLDRMYETQCTGGILPYVYYISFTASFSTTKTTLSYKQLTT